MTAPDMVSVIAAALAAHWRSHVDIAGDDIRFVCECGTVELVKGSGHSSTTTWSRAHQARAVLAAISEAGNVEWALFRKNDLLTAMPFERWRFKTQAEAQHYIEQGGFSSDAQLLIEPRSRLTFPWERAE